MPKRDRNLVRYNAGMSPPPEGHGRHTDDIASTRWSVVLAAGARESPASHEALETLCQTYWYPLYAYIRRRVGSENEAQDLTQAFFAKLLENNYVAAADPQRGKFRAFLLTSLKHFLVNEWKKQRTQKRGGGKLPISLDLSDAESRYRLEPANQQTPEKIFERRWAVTLVNAVLLQLRQEFRESGKEKQFEQLKGFLVGAGDDTTYARASQTLNISEGAVRVAAHRLRKRYRQLLRNEIAQTVSAPNEIDEEIRNLFVALGL